MVLINYLELNHKTLFRRVRRKWTKDQLPVYRVTSFEIESLQTTLLVCIFGQFQAPKTSLLVAIFVRCQTTPPPILLIKFCRGKKIVLYTFVHFFVLLFPGTFKIHGNFFPVLGHFFSKVHEQIQNVHGQFSVIVHGHFSVFA